MVLVKLVPLALVNDNNVPTFKLVLVAPIPRTVKPPMTVVLTLVPPIWIPPKAAPVPMLMVVVPMPVPRLRVVVVPTPILTVSATLELPMVMMPVPWGAPMVRAPESEPGLSLVIARLVPVALVKVKLVELILVEVTLVPVAVVKPKAPERVPPVSKR